MVRLIIPPTPGYIDSAKDPMASPGNEFMGDFHLSGCFVIYDTVTANTSGVLCINEVNQVVSLYSTIQTNSAAWLQGSKWTDVNGNTYLTDVGDNISMRTITPVTDGLTVSGSIATYNEFLTSRDGGQTFVDIEPFFGNLYTFNISPSAPTISEAFTGDGTTTLFESACAIDTTSRILVNIGGVAQLPTTHYTISANPTRSNKADIKILPAVATDVPIEVRHFPSSNTPWTINSDETIYYNQANVGIGTNAPSKRLTIAGDVSASGTLIVGGDLEIGRTASPWIDGGSSIYYNGGNVGIGTTSPSEALTVVGNVSADGNVYSRDRINVKAYGAVGDGTTDDTTAFHNAIADAKLYNVPVYVPMPGPVNGQYLITQTLSCLQVNMIGERGGDESNFADNGEYPTLKGGPNLRDIVLLTQSGTSGTSISDRTHFENWSC